MVTREALHGKSGLNLVSAISRPHERPKTAGSIETRAIVFHDHEPHYFQRHWVNGTIVARLLAAALEIHVRRERDNFMAGLTWLFIRRVDVSVAWRLKLRLARDDLNNERRTGCLAVAYSGMPTSAWEGLRWSRSSLKASFQCLQFDLGKRFQPALIRKISSIQSARCLLD